MTRILISLFFTGISFLSLSAQTTDYRDVINDSLEVYLQANYDQDYDKIMDMIYPKLFDIVPREQMINAFKGAFSEGIEIEMSNGQIGEISDLMVYEKERFARVEYSMDLSMRFVGEQYEGESVQDMLYDSFVQSYGADNVTRKDGAFNINTKSAMLAIAPEGAESWKFLEIKPEQMEFMKMMLADKVIETFVE